MIKSIGEVTLEDHDDANIPCNIFIHEITEDDHEDLDAREDEDEEESDEPRMKTWAKWKLTADLFMPRKGLYSDCIFYVADSREEILHLVKEKILPYYELAHRAVAAMAEGKNDTFYYWDEPEPPEEKGDSN